jgi:hypothetical protein
MILQQEIERFQATSKNHLRYTKKDENSVAIFNNLNERIAELNLAFTQEQIYNDVWFGFVTSDEYKEIMEGAYLYYFAKTKCTKKLCNTLGLQGGMDPETTEWFGSSLLPKLLDAGMKYNALIIPEDIFAQQTMEEFERNMGNNLARLFPGEKDALLWLRSVN